MHGESIKTVKIGKQEWMTKNLNVSIFRNGDRINEAKTIQEWINAADEQIPSWCYYDNDVRNGEIYGKLYNWHAVGDPRCLAPEGWHIPSDEEWKILEGTVDSQYDIGNPEWDIEDWRGLDAGSKLKEVGTMHWNSPNIDATNSSGFTALPGGYRYYRGPFYNLGNYARFWSSTECGNSAVYRFLSNTKTNIRCWSYYLYNGKGNGFSVRCLRDYY